jgi:AbrB family looped-hinge helix DNA binding protein
MPRVTTKGQVTIPKEIRDELGIKPGDEVAFEESANGYTIQKKEPTAEDGGDPFEKHRGSAGRDETNGADETDEADETGENGTGRTDETAETMENETNETNESDEAIES